MLRCIPYASTSSTKLHAMDVTDWGETSSLKCDSCGKLGHTAKFCITGGKSTGGDDLGDRGRIL